MRSNFSFQCTARLYCCAMSICTICRDTLHWGPHPQSLPCGHVYHESCIIIWLQNNSNCPFCRQTTTFEQLQRIFLQKPESDSSIQEEMEQLQSMFDSVSERNRYLEGNRVKLYNHIKKKNEKCFELETTINTFQLQVERMKEEITAVQARCVSTTEKLQASIKEVKNMKTTIKILASNNRESEKITKYFPLSGNSGTMVKTYQRKEQKKLNKIFGSKITTYFKPETKEEKKNQGIWLERKKI